jgi:NarL family two-component system response regulator LiaR
MTETAPIRIMLVGAHALVRNSLKLFLSTHKDLEVVAEASQGEQTLKLCPHFQSDVLLLDMVIADIDGLTIIKALCDLCPSTKVLILTGFPAETLVQQALQAGAVGYLFKDDSPDQLLVAIRAAHTSPPI